MMKFIGKCFAVERQGWCTSTALCFPCLCTIVAGLHKRWPLLNLLLSRSRSIRSKQTKEVSRPRQEKHRLQLVSQFPHRFTLSEINSP